MDMEVKWKWKCYALTRTDHGNGIENGIGNGKSRWNKKMENGR